MAMTTIAVLSPLQNATPRVEKPLGSAHALPEVATVQPLPDQPTNHTSADRPALPQGRPESFTFRKSADAASDADAPIDDQPFPDVRFADPLPDLPELDLPTKAAAYQSALSMLRGPENG
jgi:hypothetical protein